MFPAFCPVHSGIKSSLQDHFQLYLETTQPAGLILANAAHLFDYIDSKNKIYPSIRFYAFIECQFFRQRSRVKGCMWKPYCTNFTLLKTKGYFLYISHEKTLQNHPERAEK